jgi:hypothetical protein
MAKERFIADEAREIGERLGSNGRNRSSTLSSFASRERVRCKPTSALAT